MHWSLIDACRKSRISVVEQLISEGVNVNARDSCGYTPLLEASTEGNLSIVELLLSKGANVNDTRR